MSTVVPGTILSNTNNQRYGYSFDSIYNTMLKPQIFSDYIKYYGGGVGMLGLAYLAGTTVNIAGPSKRVWEEGSYTKLVEIAGAIAIAGAGVDITFHLAATEYSTNNTCYLNTNEIVVIPAEYMEELVGGVLVPSTIPHGYQVTGNDGLAGVLRTYTARPLLVTQALAVAVPDTTELMVRGGNYALESASGSGKSSGWYSRYFYNSIKKWDWQIGGGTQSNQRYYEELKGGGTGILSKLTMEADHQLDLQVDDEILLSTGVTNTTLTMPNRALVNIPVAGTVGVLRHMEQRAMKQYYTAAYQMSDFDDLKDLLNSQGVTERNLAFLMGSSLYQQIENSNLDFIKEFSGGTDLMKTLGEIKVAFRAVNKNGVYTVFKELPQLSDPTRYGAPAFNDYFKDLGFIIPEVDVTLSGGPENPTPMKLRNLTIGFKNYLGENRTRIVKDMPSVAGQGNIALDSFDDSRGTMLTEFSLIFNKVNQTILVQNDNIL
jgi:hypothetical protein